jgi:N6-L-threonylcarbamoyladenine synthase
MLGIDFPCGAQMDNLALENSKKLAPIKISVKELRCNLSGLENLAADLWKKSEDRSLVSAYAFEYISKTLYSLTDNLRAVYPDLPVVYAGGVMSSTYIKSRLQRDNVYFAMPAFSADNAAGISLLCRNKYFNGNN